MKSIKELRSRLSFNIISAIVLLLLVFSVVVSAIGFTVFTNSLKREYTDSALNTAATATSIVNADDIALYLGGEKLEEHARTQGYLDTLCEKMQVSLIYVISFTPPDFGSYTCVFDSVESGSGYSVWERGSVHESTNDQNRAAYSNLYGGKSEYEVVFRTRNLHGNMPHITVMVPVKNSAGETVAVTCVQRPMRELIDGRAPYLYTIALATLLQILITSLIAAVYIRKQFVVPLTKINSEATRFAGENSAPETPLSPDMSDIGEISSLARSIGLMETEILEYIDNITKITADRERIGAELNIASSIQENSVPNIFPAFPERAEFDVFASMSPAKEVGGDFYDFFLIDENRLAVVMADVSGKGVPAALFMMVTKILINDRSLMGGTPGEILTFVNDRICENNRADMFVTVWLGILDISDGTLTFANAGHDDPAVCRNGGIFAIEKTRHGPVIGAMSGIQYRDHALKMEKGDRLFLYTDGIPEATDLSNNMFTIEGMVEALNSCRGLSPREMLSQVRSKVDSFVGDAPQFDDITMLCLEYRGKAEEKSLTVRADNKSLAEVTDFVENFLEEKGASPKIITQLELSVEEIFVNIANYAYGDEGGDASIRLKEENGSVFITFEDSGIPYNPLEKEDPDITLSADEREPGGLGIFIVKKSSDSVTYSRTDGKNILTIAKKLK